MKPGLWGLLAIFFAGCGNNHAPTLQPISDQTAGVGVELSIELRATDADGDTLHFDFDAPAIGDIKSRAQLSAFADNVAIFRWTPQASDRSDTPYAFDFSVSDGKATTTETVQITVSDAAGGSAPVFRQPLGTGTTLDLSMEMCIDVPIEVEDSDSTMVTITEDDPKIDGAMLTQNDAFTGTWHWCPSDMQIAQQDRYTLHLLADDGTNQTPKAYLIVLRTAPQMNCPGMPPAIDHTPLTAQSTVADVQISADVSDDLGVKSVLLYWTTTMPADPPDISKMTPVSMSLASGDALSGTWQGAIPNPVASAATGTKMTVYYLIEAKDNDDATGTCDHVVDSPMTGTYAVDVTNPGTMSGTGVNCNPCSSDAQCSTGYECINVAGGTFCAKECSGAGTCDANYSCSSTPLTSLGGKSHNYCRATSMTCPPTMVCVEDSLEDNDTRTNIKDATSANLPPGTYNNLVVCPRNGGTSADEDWYAVYLPQSAIVTAAMTIKDYSVGSHADLDMELTDSGGVELDGSFGTGTTEYVSACQPSPGPVYIHVLTFDTTVVASKYDLVVTRTGADSAEPDDSAAQAPDLPLMGQSVTQNICISEDWFAVVLLAGDQLTVDVKFTARSDNEILSARLMRDDCSHNTAATQAATGATITGGVRVSYTTPTGGDDCYYVVVSGPTSGGNVYTLTTVTSP